MKTMRYTVLSLMSFALASCSTIPQEAYYNRGEPESLLDIASEAVTISLQDAGAERELVDWINREQPTRADLSCAGPTSLACTDARLALDQFNVPYEFEEGMDNEVTLYYERIMARDCENRFIDNSINPYNLNHPTFGCSTAVNMVQQVSDKRQFVNPNLLEYPDAEKAVQAMDKYRMPTTETEDDSSPLSSIISGSGN